MFVLKRGKIGKLQRITKICRRTMFGRPHTRRTLRDLDLQTVYRDVRNTVEGRTGLFYLNCRGAVQE